MDIEREKYINPFTDFGFKKLFGTEVNKDLLMDFLNELVREKGKITDVKYLNAEQLGRAEYERRAVFDIYCETDLGEKFIVEMQKSKHDFFKDRSVFYASFPISGQARKGPWSFELKAVYTIGILDFVFNENKEDKDYYHSEVKLMDTRQKTVFYDKLTFIYLEMPKFNKELEQLETRFDKWMYVLKNLPRLQRLPPQLQEKIFEKVFHVAEIAKITLGEAAEYEASLKVYRDWYSVLSTAENEGQRKGMAQGIAQGMAQGMAQGRAEGKIEGKLEEKNETALKALAMGMSVEDASKLTGLSQAYIEGLVSRK